MKSAREAFDNRHCVRLSLTHLQNCSDPHVHPLAVDECAIGVGLLKDFTGRVVRDFVSPVPLQVLKHLEDTIDENDEGEEGQLRARMAEL